MPSKTEKMNLTLQSYMHLSYTGLITVHATFETLSSLFNLPCILCIVHASCLFSLLLKLICCLHMAVNCVVGANARVQINRTVVTLCQTEKVDESQAFYVTNEINSSVKCIKKLISLFLLMRKSHVRLRFFLKVFYFSGTVYVFEHNACQMAAGLLALHLAFSK